MTPHLPDELLQIIGRLLDTKDLLHLACTNRQHKTLHLSTLHRSERIVPYLWSKPWEDILRLLAPLSDDVSFKVSQKIDKLRYTDGGRYAIRVQRQFGKAPVGGPHVLEQYLDRPEYPQMNRFIEQLLLRSVPDWCLFRHQINWRTTWHTLSTISDPIAVRIARHILFLYVDCLLSSGARDVEEVARLVIPTTNDFDRLDPRTHPLLTAFLRKPNFDTFARSLITTHPSFTNTTNITPALQYNFFPEFGSSDIDAIESFLFDEWTQILNSVAHLPDAIAHSTLTFIYNRKKSLAQMQVYENSGGYKYPALSLGNGIERLLQRKEYPLVNAFLEDRAVAGFLDPGGYERGPSTRIDVLFHMYYHHLRWINGRALTDDVASRIVCKCFELMLPTPLSASDIIDLINILHFLKTKKYCKVLSLARTLVRPGDANIAWAIKVASKGYLQFNRGHVFEGPRRSRLDFWNLVQVSMPEFTKSTSCPPGGFDDIVYFREMTDARYLPRGKGERDELLFEERIWLMNQGEENRFWKEYLQGY
ncbi:hypothetical protein HK097_010210 [Rhizophlyctis rosea]|uniref:F-box domain-containing protein n=1 Tax=Rhizophlyctis rosea TaxID=64517 RepID=A0AAD5SHI0_9FUNG|nr:hypothetical protein HK097_010210 [Rhizophlyctis rosea]